MIYSDNTLNFFNNHLHLLVDFNEINHVIKNVSGINLFFTSQDEATELLKTIQQTKITQLEHNIKEYGDFQTNNDLAKEIINYIFLKNNAFEFILEPTCGKGNFILASLQQSDSIKKIVGVEIYKPYVWQTKFKILDYFLANQNKNKNKPEIDIIHANAFEFDYNTIASETVALTTLIIGNPPWVTNSELSLIESNNLPKKSNFKKHSGFEAITGKANFDIGEYISLMMLRCFHHHNGTFAFLLKGSVVKNLIQEQKNNCFQISQCEKLNIDSKKEFNVSVHSCLFVAQLNTPFECMCKEFCFYDKKYITTFGWHKENFVSSITDYDKLSFVDGKSIFVWRSGVKHDCAKIMELEQKDDYYINGLGEKIHLEKELVFGLLKSSDLKVDKTNSFRKLTIITQKKVGEETCYISKKLPLTYQYLNNHKEVFEKRKSSIYKNKPAFSIFGIGEYSFAQYKVAISGLYKSTHFTLITPQDTKPLMLDDTCYFIGFDNLKMAQIAHYLLNSELAQKFLKSIIFSDAKRSINKEILMRIDLKQLFEHLDFATVKKNLNTIDFENWEVFGKLINNGKIC